MKNRANCIGAILQLPVIFSIHFVPNHNSKNFSLKKIKTSIFYFSKYLLININYFLVQIQYIFLTHQTDKNHSTDKKLYLLLTIFYHFLHKNYHI